MNISGRSYNRPDTYVKDNRSPLITLIEVGITSQEILLTVETEKLRKYDLLANKLSLVHKCEVNITAFVLT